MRASVINALTVDVEDAVNQAMRNIFNTDMAPTHRVCDNTLRLLDLFSAYDTTATFFILGEVAMTFPDLIREISRRGHELGIHGFSHRRYHSMTRAEVREEIFSAKHLIEDLTGVQVIGHRAPEFSINRETAWVLEILLDAGIKYDSSIFPVKGDRYGWPGFKKEIGTFAVDDGRTIIEAPLSVANYLGKEFPVCGGGYLRAYPFQFTDHAFKQIMSERPVILYLHPYETDLPPFQEFYMDAIRKSKINTRIKLKKYWYNRKSVMPKLNLLLQKYSFSSLQNVIEQELKQNFNNLEITG